MDHDTDEHDTPIDLGTASIVTKGPPGNQFELGAIGRVTGLTDD